MASWNDKERRIFGVISVVMGLQMSYYVVQYILVATRVGVHLEQAGSYLLSLIPSILALVGVFVFVATSFRNSRLIRFSMCIQILNFPFVLMAIIRWHHYVTANGNDAPAILFISALVTLTTLIYSSAGLWMLSKKRQPKFEYSTFINDELGELVHTQPATRFLNRLIDVLVVFYVLFTQIMRQDVYSMEYPKRYFWPALMLSLGYYLFFESVFGTTAGKCITNTIVVNEQGGKPFFAQTFLRSICRFIPFDSLSFFRSTQRCWHDTISGTYVVASELPEKKDDEDLLSFEM